MRQQSAVTGGERAKMAKDTRTVGKVERIARDKGNLIRRICVLGDVRNDGRNIRGR